MSVLTENHLQTINNWELQPADLLVKDVSGKFDTRPDKDLVGRLHQSNEHFHEA